MITNKKSERGYTLIEIILVISIGAIIITGVTLSMFKFQNSFIYDSLLNNLIESINYSRLRALSSELDLAQERNSYSVKFFEDRFVEFEGEEYIEGTNSNIENTVPVGFKLSADCDPGSDNIITFSPLLGENLNNCVISIHGLNQTTPLGNINIGRYGVEQAS